MDLTESQFQSLVESVAERVRATLVPAAAPVQLPPEFYQSQREIADRVLRLEERFEQVDRRFDNLIHYVDKRFSVQQWIIGAGFLVLTTLMTAYQFLA